MITGQTYVSNYLSASFIKVIDRIVQMELYLPNLTHRPNFNSFYFV